MKIKRDDGILKIMLIGFILIFTGNAVEYFFIDIENLRRVDGTVREIILKKYRCSGGYRYSTGTTCEKTILKLEGSSRSYVVADESGEGSYISEIEKGDKVTIYVRKWYQYFLTFGFYDDIYYLEKDGEWLYDIGRWKASNKAFMLFFGIFSLFFGGLYILQRVTINQLIKGKAV